VARRRAVLPKAVSNHVPERAQQAIALALLSILTTLVFLPSLEHEFLNWDDRNYIHRNSWLHSSSFLSIISMFGGHYYFNYHPLTLLSYMLEFQLFGYEPAGYHASNIVLHVAAVLLLFALLRLLNADVWTCFFLAQLFAIHPLRIESVVWISERKDLLCSVFYLLGLCLWIMADKSFGRRERQLISASILAFLLASLSKAMAISFPLVVFLNDVLCRRERLKARIPSYLAMLAVALLFGYLNIHAQKGAINAALSLVERAKLAVYAPLHYAIKTIVPLRLAALYPLEFRPTRSSLLFVTGCVFLSALIGVAGATARRHPRLTFGILSAGVILAPVSGIVLVGNGFAADRYSYLPTALLLAGIAPFLSQKIQEATRALRVFLCFCGMVLVASCVPTTMNLATAWKESISLWARVLSIYPESVVGRRQLADAWSLEGVRAYESGESDIAEKFFRRAVQIFPADGKALHSLVGNVLRNGRHAEAEEILRRALSTPGIGSISRTYALAMMSVIARARGEEDRADSLLHAAFSLGRNEPTTGADLGFLAWTALQAGDSVLAMNYYEKALAVDPLNLSALQNLALLSAKIGEQHRALLLFRRILQVYPDHDAARYNVEILGRQIAIRQSNQLSHVDSGGP
jgi:tetratricopeptide (TPR) repeat protein